MLSKVRDVIVILAALAGFFVYVNQFVRGYQGVRAVSHGPEMFLARYRGGLLPLPAGALPSPGANMVLFFSTACHFCTDSMGFYKQLAANQKIPLVALYSVEKDTQSGAEAYLDHHGLKPYAIAGVSAVRFHDIPQTPFLVLLGNDGFVQAAWSGQQDEKGEAEILKRMQNLRN